MTPGVAQVIYSIFTHDRDFPALLANTIESRAADLDATNFVSEKIFAPSVRFITAEMDTLNGDVTG